MKTSKAKIAEYWQKNCPYDEIELNVDIADMPFHCWNCGDDCRSGKSNDISKTRLQRCHIIPNSEGGNDTPENYMLLCKQCHIDAPDSTYKNAMWEWVKSNKTKISLYGTYRMNKGLEIFEKRYGCSFLKDIAPLISDDAGKGAEIIAIEFKNIIRHGGFKVNPESYVALFRKIQKDYTNL